MLPDLASDDVTAMSMSLLANMYRPATGGDWIEFDYTPVETQQRWAVQLGSWRVGSEADIGQLAAIMDFHQELVAQTVTWKLSGQLENHRLSVQQCITEFQGSLEPDSRLNRLIVSGRCGDCV